MPKSVKYFVYGGQSSFVEFDLDYSAAGVTLRGSEVIYTGGSGVETVYAARGVGFDFTNASGGVDRLYLSASIAEYSFLKQGTNLLLTEMASGSVVKVLAGSSLSFDRVVFTDGMVSSKALYDAAGSGVTPALDAGTKTPTDKRDLYALLGTLPESSVKAFAATNDGITFGTVPKGGATLIATGGSGVDIVYVASWSKVDAVDLSGGTDRIYLTGSFSDYSRSYQGTTLVLSRSDGNNSEIVKVNGGSSFAFDRIVFADGAARSWDLFNAVKNNAVLPVLDTSLTTPGLAPVLKSSPLSNIVDLDVRSNIVLQFAEDVTPQAGKFIRIVNDSNTSTKSGLYGESVSNTFVFDASDPRVQISGGSISIDPGRDLDFSNNYHIEIEAGAFVGKTTGKPNVAIVDPAVLKFSTVTPSSDKTVSSNEGLSRIMQPDGSLAESLVWKDIEGWPNGKTGSQAVLDLAGRNIALVTADLMPAASILDLSGDGNSLTNIETGDFNLKITNFDAGDLIYMDDLGRNNEDSDETLQLIFGPQFSSFASNGVSISRFNFDAVLGKAGGAIEIAGQLFTTPDEWQQLVGASQSPFVYGSAADTSAPADTTPPTLQSASVSADGRTVTLTFSEPLDFAAATSAQLLSRFSVSAGSTSSWSFESAQVQGSTVVLTTPSTNPIPSPASLSPSTVSVSYTDVSAGDDVSAVVQDAAGNDAPAFGNHSVVNNSTYTPQPALSIQGLTAANTVGEGASITYTVTLSDFAGEGGFVVDWRVVPHSPGDPAEAGDFGATAASAAFPSGSITIAQGFKTGQIVVPIFDDALQEGDEVFDLQVGKLGTSGEFTMALEHWTMIYASDSGGSVDDFCTINPATDYAAYVAAQTVSPTVPTGVTSHVSSPVPRDGFINEVASYGLHYTAAVDGFIAAVSGLSTTTTFGFVLETFETRAAGNFAGADAGYTAAAGTSVTGQSGSVTSGDGSGTLVIDDRMAIKLFNIGSNIGTGGSNPGNDPGIANNLGNDADRGYNQTEDGNLYLEVLPADERAGGVLVCFDEIGTAVYGFGLHLMGREEDKRDVYLDVHFSDGSIYRELTGTNPNGTGGEQFYAFTIAPTAGKTIEGFVLYEPWATGDGGDRRDIFAIDDLALVVAGKTDSLTGAQYREEILGRNDGGGADSTPPVLTISSPSSKILADGYASIQFQLSEPVTGFDLSDVVVTGGVLDYFSGSGSNYFASFRPNAGFDGQSTFSVAAGAFSDVAGNASTAAASLSVPTFTIQPGNSGRTYFTTPGTGTSDLVIGFSEKIQLAYPESTSVYGFYLTLNPDPSNPYGSNTGTLPQVNGYSLSSDGKTLTLNTNTLFTADDVVKVSILGNTSFVDADGNDLAEQDLYIGGEGPSTIDLEYFGSISRQILRGNGGADMLVGTYNADTLIDGGGADMLDGLGGGDSFFLVENDSPSPDPLANASDTVFIGLGDSRRGVGNTDAIFGDPANANSGFDWFSSNTANHDVLNLESALIGGASSFVSSPAKQGDIVSHSISSGSGGAAGLGGIVTFLDGDGNAIAIRQGNPSLGNALNYLLYNLQAPGHTVAFKADYDNDNTAESLFVYQDMGTLPLADDAEMPDIVVRIDLPDATAVARLNTVTLGNAPGANVLQIQDDFSPEPWAIALTASGVTYNFVEPVYGPTAGASALAMSLQVNGTGTVFTPTAIAGEGTAAVTVQSAGLNMALTDWALVTYAGTSVGNALSDAAGNWLSAHDDEGDPTASSTFAFALGGEGDNVIDLSAFNLPTGAYGMGVEAAGGDDRVIGTSGNDWIVGGRGADTMTGGAGGDEFEFEQGDSPVVTVDVGGVPSGSFLLAGAKYTFPNGEVEVITDFDAGDRVYLYPVLDGLTGARWLSPPFSSTGSGNGEPPTGLPDDQGFMVLQGDLATTGVFTVGMDYGTGADLLVVYDGNGGDDVTPTAFVLKGVTMSDIESLYGGGNSIRSNKPVDNGGGGGGGGGEGNPQGTATVVFQQSVSIDDLIDATIFDDTGTPQITSTMLTVVSGDGLASVRLMGSGLTWTALADGDFDLTGGTITRAEFDLGTIAGARSPAVVVSGLAIDAVVLDAAVDEAWDTNLQDTSAFDALLDAYQYDITGTAASERLEGSQWDDTLRGGGGGDTLVGWEGDDVLIVGSNAAGFEYGLVSPGTGNDTIDYSAVVTGDHLLSYEFQPAGVDLSIDGVNKVGSVLKGSSGQWEDTLLGVDKFLNVANHATVAGSAQILGSAHADTFEINLAGNQWISIRGLAGSDTFEFTGNGWARLDYILSPDGVDVNLALGEVYDDGYGTQDTITGKVNELRGSNSSDQLIGSGGDESFIPRGGNDTIDGGVGFDRVRYDQGNLTALEVDLLEGRATGFQDGVAFVHQLSGIEHVRGSNQADFLLSGTGSVRLEGRGGADEFLIDGGGQVRIDDFVIGQDVLILDAGVTLAQAQAALAAAQAVTVSGSPGAKVTFNADTSVTFRGLSVEQVAGIVPVIEQDGGDSPWAPVFTDLSASGYTSTAALESLFFDPTVLTLDNIQLAPASGTDFPATVLKFDLILDLTDPDVQAMDPLGVIVQFGGDLDGVLDAFAFSPSSWSFGGQSVPYWEFNDSDLAAHRRLYASPYGIAEFETDPQIYEQNPLAEASGRVGQVQVLLDGEVIEPPQISVEDLIVFPIDWLSGTAPVLMVEVMEPSQVQIGGLTDDNLLKYFVDYDEISDKTHLKAKFDEDPDLNQVQPSNLIELTFPGDVRSSLAPESLTFSS